MIHRFSRVSVGLCVATVALLGVVGCGGRERVKMDADALVRVQRVAVMPFSGETPAGTGAKSGDAVAAGFAEALRLYAPRFVLVERTRLRDVVAEKKKRIAGAVGEPGSTNNTGSAESVMPTDTAKFLQVDAIADGAVQEYSRNPKLADVGYLGGHTVAATVKLIDVRTGRVLYTASGFANGRDSFSDALREACRQMVIPLAQLPASPNLPTVGGH